MRLKYICEDMWPPLAWLVRAERGKGEVIVYHGKRIETKPEWFCEAVWAGEFQTGEFDKTDIIFGSGGRARSGSTTFVSSGSTVDRLQFMEIGNLVLISNSLPCLLEGCGASLIPTYPDYYLDTHSIVLGLHKYRQTLPTSKGPVQLVYFDNIIWSGEDLKRQSKPSSTENFDNFENYREFLNSSMMRLANNLSDVGRQFPYKMLTTISTGYDSPTVAVLAKECGCEDALTFSQSRGGESDSGEDIAGRLGLRAHVVERNAWREQEESMPELTFIAAGPGGGGDVVFKGAEEHLKGRLLLTGFHGDKMWDKNTKNLSEFIIRGDPSGSGFMEYRLWVGFLHCPMPFWGVRRIREVSKISLSSEMSPWDIPGYYSRPICRRIVETVNVPRESFGMNKKAIAFMLHKPLGAALLQRRSTIQVQRVSRDIKEKLLTRYETHVHAASPKTGIGGPG